MDSLETELSNFLFFKLRADRANKVPQAVDVSVLDLIFCVAETHEEKNKKP